MCKWVSSIDSADDLNKIKQKDFSWVLSPGAHIPDLDFFQPLYFMSQTKSSKYTNIILHWFYFSGATS